MLRELRVKRFAVIEEVTVPFAPGLNVLTGETGAGKSIVMEAILLLRGARAQSDLIRSDSESATVEAIFDIDPGGEIPRILEDLGHTAEDWQLIIRREWSRSGSGSSTASACGKAWPKWNASSTTTLSPPRRAWPGPPGCSASSRSSTRRWPPRASPWNRPRPIWRTPWGRGVASGSGSSPILGGWRRSTRAWTP